MKQNYKNTNQNNPIIRLLLLLLLVGGVSLSGWGQDQVWTYDFNVASATHSSGESTTFFPLTPADGGTYRVRIGTQGGQLELDGDKAILTAATGGSANKTGVYAWDNPTSAAYVKFELKTSSTDNGRLAIALGNDGLVTNNSGYSGNYDNALVNFWINYSSGEIASVQRRQGSSNLSISSHGFLTNTEQIVEIYGNNSSAVALYERNDISYSLDPQSWDLWVAGTKISPEDGWPVARNLAANDNLSGFVFFGEISNDNVATITLDDYEYANHLPQPDIEDPIFFADPASIDGLNYAENNGPSDSQSFILTGENLDPADAEITLTAPTNFQVSLDDDNFNDTQTLNATDGSLTETVYVRLASGLSPDDYSGNLAVTGGAAHQLNVSLIGRVVDEFDIPYTNDLRTEDDFERAVAQGFVFEDAALNTGAGGRIDISPDGYIETSELDFRDFDFLVTQFDLRNLGSGDNRELTVKVKGDGLALTPIQTVAISSTSDVTFNVLIDLTDDYNVDNGIIRFEMTGGTGISPGIRFRDLTIDEPVSVADIAELRDGETDGWIYRLVGEAVVNFAQSFRNQKWIQDETAAIYIDDNEYIILGGEERFSQGDGISYIFGTLSTFANTLRITPIVDANGPFETALAIEPAVITMSQFINNFSDFESQLVTIEDVSFSDANGVLEFSNGNVYDITDGELTGEFRATFYDVDFINSVIPGTSVNLTGILNERTSEPEGKFISARNWADFAFLSQDDGNWPTLPEEASFVINHDIALGGPATVANLTISDGQTLTIAPVGTLTVTGTLTNENNGAKSGAGLLIESNDTGTGSLIHNTPGVQATTERYIEEVNDWGTDNAVDWHFLSSPVANQAIAGGWVADDVAGGYDFFAWREATATWLNQKVGANNITHFIPGVGYLVAYETTDTKEFIGELNTGEVSFTLLYDSHMGKDKWEYQPGWNLLGNPYPSAIDWNAVDHAEGTSLFADNFAYIYNRAKGGGIGGYEEIDGTDPGAIIPANQGFFVRAKSGSHNQDFTFTNAMRVHGGDIYKNQTLAGELLKLRLANDYYDETTIRVLEGSGFERDRTDALKLFSFADYAPQLYTFTSNHVMVAINSIPKIDEYRQIRLGVLIPEDGEYTLSVQELGTIFSDGPLYLLDNATGIQHNLNETPEYVFTASAGTYNQRFRISFAPQDDDDSVNITDPDQQTAVRIWQHNNILHVDNPDTDLNLYLYDISGRRLQHFDAPAGQHQFELNLPAGAYFVKSSGESQYETVKIIIK